MAKPFTVIDTRPLVSTRVFSLRADRAVPPKGGEAGEYYVLDTPDWVNVIAETEDDEVVLVKQWRHGSRRVELEIPGGLIEPGEAPLMAAARELMEETGYEAAEMEILQTIRPNPAFMDNECTTVLAKGCRRVGPQALDDDEDIDILRIGTEIEADQHQTLAALRADRDEVFALLTDYPRLCEWLPGVESARVLAREGDVVVAEVAASGLGAPTLVLELVHSPPSSQGKRSNSFGACEQGAQRVSGWWLLGVLANELVVNVIAQAVDHQALHLGFDIAASDPVLVKKLDPHSGWCIFRRLFRRDDPLHLALEDDGLFESGDLEFEEKLRIDIQGFVCLYERAASADVPGVVRKKRIEAPILYL